MKSPKRAILATESFRGKGIFLRLVTRDDCTPRYVRWLRDPLVNQFLETRWTPQNLSTVRDFVKRTQGSHDSYLFAIVEAKKETHIGNIKVGPIHPNHHFADLSYFIGERTEWNKGYASEAIRLAARISFDRLGLHRVQAGCYASNVASRRALEKIGFKLEATLRERVLNANAEWEDLLLFGLLRSEAELQ